MSQSNKNKICTATGHSEDGVLAESRPSLISRPFRHSLWRLSQSSGVAPIIASSGRAGSTMLFDAVPAAMLPLRTLQNNARAKIWLTETAWDLNRRKFRPGIVYKTHDYPPKAALPNFTRIVYTFSDPTEVVFSLLKQDRKLGRAWIDEHYAHLRAPKGGFDKITQEDTLCLGRHFHAWMQPQAYPVLCVKYSALWSSVDKISDFLGMKVTLPAYRPRQTDLSQLPIDQVDQVRETYAELAKEIQNAPDCQLFSPSEPATQI